MLHLSILAFQTLDRIIFGTLTFPETRWYALTVRDRDQKSLESTWWYAIRKVWEPLPYTMSSGSLIPILVIFTALPRCKFGHVGTCYFYANRHYLVQFLITDLKQNKRNIEKKSGQISSYLKS